MMGIAIAVELFSSMARAPCLQPRGCEFESHHRHAHCKFLYWYQEFRMRSQSQLRNDKYIMMSDHITKQVVQALFSKKGLVLLKTAKLDSFVLSDWEKQQNISKICHIF